MQSSAGMPARAGILAALLATALPSLATAQYDDVPRPAAYALQNVTVVQADGRRQEGVTVVVRGSLIEAMGRNVTVPGDAELLEGESLMVYPGFVDGDGEAAHEFPNDGIDRSEVEIWNAPRPLQGFMPARRLVSYLTADGEGVAARRREGIVAAAVHPSGAMMGGRGVLVMYRKDASMPQQLVIEPTLGPKFELRGGQGVYPGTLFGVMAFIRQSFEDARHREELAAAQARDPRGLTMPPYDPDYAVLQEVLSGDATVYFAADDAPDILRVVGLADEYGFRPVIVGGGEAWKVADELRSREIPVLVSTDFPEPRRWDPEEDAADPLDAAAQREKDRIELRYANPARLSEAGITFALTSGGTGKVLEGARKAVEHGLSEAAALAALTSTPAGLLGIPTVARIEEGLPATFVVTNGPLFDEDTEIAFTFVEGFVEEASEPRATAGSAEDAVAFGGEWRMTIRTDEEQTFESTLRVEQDGATFTGTMELMGTDAAVRDGVINGNEISAVVVMTQGGETMEIEITGTVEGDEASGEADSPMGSARWTARRAGPGGER